MWSRGSALSEDTDVNGTLPTNIFSVSSARIGALKSSDQQSPVERPASGAAKISRSSSSTAVTVAASGATIIVGSSTSTAAT